MLVRRLNAQGYLVDATTDAAMGADMALTAPPAAMIADLWMPSISGVQLCRLLRAEPATAEVPVILRGEDDDPKSRFWAERAGATAYVRKGRMGELVRTLATAIERASDHEGFFMQLSGGSLDIRDRIARHLDAALFDSVIAAEVRALATCGSFERLFDQLSQLLSQLIGYRWMALSTTSPPCFGVHHHPRCDEVAEREARAALGRSGQTALTRIADEDAREEPEGPEPIVCDVPFGNLVLGRLALAPVCGSDEEAARLNRLVAQELGGPLKMAALVDEQQRLAMVDPLTGLMNRRSFLTQMKVELARSARYRLPLSVILLDIDHFKAINDARGHAAGDLVLTRVGELLRGILRVSDVSARWGGEEFVMALTNTDEAGAYIVAERVRVALQAFVIEHEGQRIPVTASLGVASYEAEEKFDPLIDRADRAMYEAKAHGRNRVVVWGDAGNVRRADAAATAPVERAADEPDEELEPGPRAARSAARAVAKPLHEA